MFDPKKGKYTDEENEQIIQAMNKGLKEGKREREIINEISEQLNRGYAGIMSHIRKLKSQYPDRFIHTATDSSHSQRLNSWESEEEDLVIKTVNTYLDEGKPLAAAIAKLEEELSRTQGAIYQRIYTLRKRNPERFKHLPAKRPRRRRKLQDWQVNRPIIRNLNPSYEEESSQQLFALNQELLKSWNSSDNESPTEDTVIFQAFEERYGRLNIEAKEILTNLIQKFGPTRVSIVLLTLPEDKSFATTIANFLASRLQEKYF